MTKAVYDFLFACSDFQWNCEIAFYFVSYISMATGMQGCSAPTMDIHIDYYFFCIPGDIR